MERSLRVIVQQVVLHEELPRPFGPEQWSGRLLLENDIRVIVYLNQHRTVRGERDVHPQ